MENDTPQDDFEPESSPEDDFSSDEEMPVEDEQFPEEELPPEENEYSPEDEGVYPEDEQYPEENEDYPEDEAPLEDATYPEEEGEYPEEGEDYPEEEYEQSPESEQIPEDIEQPPETVSPQTQKSSPKAEEKNSVSGMIVLALLVILGIGSIVYKLVKPTSSEKEPQTSEVTLTIDAKQYDMVISSSSSVEEARNALLKEAGNTANKLLDETESFYVLPLSWGEHNQKAISFKKNIYDYQRVYDSSTGWTTITNQFIVKNKDTIKTILDAVNIIKEKNNGSFEWKKSSIEEKDGKYIYEIQYDMTVYGDWGVNDETTHETRRVTIDKATGIVEKEEDSRL